MSQTQTALTALFLQSSVQDAMADYHRSLESECFPHWDAVVLTASDTS